jgi:hypothetical protein
VSLPKPGCVESGLDEEKAEAWAEVYRKLLRDREATGELCVKIRWSRWGAFSVWIEPHKDRRAQGYTRDQGAPMRA